MLPLSVRAEDLSELCLSSGESLVEWVVKHGEALVIENLNADSGIDPNSRSTWFEGSCPVVVEPDLHRRTRVNVDEPGVVKKFGFPPASVPDYLALVGDSTDGYPACLALF